MGRIEPLAEVEFAAFLEENLGLQGEASTSRGLAEVLEQRLRATRSHDFCSYRERIRSAAARREELGQLAPAVTVGETYFFRDSRQFEALMTVVLPELLHRRPSEARIQLLSVACSTGEEPYSIAIAARELLGGDSSRIQIQAFDVNPNAIAGAQRASYSEWALRATPPGLRDRYFKRQGNQFALLASICEAVHFETRNLFDEDLEYWQTRRFDIILCRNALIYFSRPKICQALRRFADALAGDGTLFLGNAETARGFEERLVAQEVCGSFCYRLDNSVPRRPSAPLVVAIAANAAPGPAATPSRPVAGATAAIDGDSWVEAIEAATQRLAYLVVHKPVAQADQLPTEPGPDFNLQLEQARQLVAVERFGEALSKLDEVLAAGHNSTHCDLLRASILTNQGRFLESIDLCRRILVNQPHSAAAYHWLGVAYEHAGRLTEARGHHEMAVTLDPMFAMSHWLLGRLYLRAGQRDAARRHLSTALDLWRVETSPSEATADLYAGGFGREALERLCRVDLASCEVRR